MQLYADGSLDQPDAVTVWARAVVWVVPAAIGLTVGLQIAARMCLANRDRPHLVDERDRKFQLYGMGVTLIAAGVGFIALLVTLVDQDNKKRRPATISGYTLFSYVGETAPSNPDDWKFITTESKLDYDYWLPSTLQVGQKVWLTCAWLNRKLETGPACQPVMTGPTFGGLSQAA